MRASNNKRAQDVLAELMKVNLSFSDMEAERKERLGRWYVWIVSEYINCVSCGTGEFKTAAEGLAAFGNKPEQQEYFELRCTADEVVDPERMNEVTYILRIITGLCKDILNGYRIMAIRSRWKRSMCFVCAYRCIKIHSELKIQQCGRDCHAQRNLRSTRSDTNLSS